MSVLAGLKPERVFYYFEELCRSARLFRIFRSQSIIWKYCDFFRQFRRDDIDGKKLFRIEKTLKRIRLAATVTAARPDPGPPVVYPAALLTGAGDAADKAFFEALSSDASDATFTEQGFEILK